MLDIIIKVIKCNKILFLIWISFTILGSLAGIGIEVFLSQTYWETSVRLVNQQVLYLVSVSLIVAYIAEVISLIKIDNYDLGIEKSNKNYFDNEKIILLSTGIFLLFFMLIAYAETDASVAMQIMFLLLTFLLGISLFAIKHYELCEAQTVKEEYDSKIDQAEKDAVSDTEKIE